MTVHITRPAVGAESVDHLQQLLRARAEPGKPPRVFITTRNVPKRVDELTDGGSVYWIIKRTLIARNSILDVEIIEEAGGKRFCHIWLDAQLVLVEPRSKRAHQGWRYLKPEDAPKDLRAMADADLPPDMAAELRELGLL